MQEDRRREDDLRAKVATLEGSFVEKSKSVDGILLRMEEMHQAHYETDAKQNERLVELMGIVNEAIKTAYKNRDNINEHIQTHISMNYVPYKQLIAVVGVSLTVFTILMTLLQYYNYTQIGK